jgi:hypothetical protein
MTKRKEVSVTEWLADKLRALAVHRPRLPEPSTRVAAPKRVRPDIVAATKCPDSVNAAEWAAAVAAVAAGSAPSTIAFGSDIPSDETVRREHAYGATMGRRERQR